MAIDFPGSPTNGQTFTSGSVTYTYDGTKWTALASGGGATDKIEEGNTSAEVIDTGSDGRFVVTTEGTERARVDSSGRLLVGTSSSSATTRLEVYGQSSSSTEQAIVRFGRGSNPGGAGDHLTTIQFAALTSGGVYSTIEAQCDGTPGTNDYPGRLVFSTTKDGQSSPSEAMRIRSDGYILIGQSSTESPGFNDAVNGISLRGSNGSAFFSAPDTTSLYVNRNTSDGTVVSIRQAGTEEGTISVSGTTVSYNGAHLSRWSQLPGGAERTEILRGTVLSNIDEMCTWGEEENEQLNRMKVSDVEGDPNVSGVFQAWDDDDDTYTDDFYCAMTGDFIIRIANGVIVQRGDLLMSAGDGTAKPQDDDIIRSKTIAKVTSSHVTCTYDDGSYCVPCVLMAC
jgi:hypothetical protein